MKINWESIGKIVGNSAPLVGNLLGGPMGGAAGNLLASFLGCENDPAVVANLLNSDPDAILKMKEFTFKHQEQLARMNLEAEKARLADVQDARDREVAITRYTGKRDWHLYFLAWSIVVGFFVVLGVLMFKPLPNAQNQIVAMLFGNLGMGLGTVIAYFFGSSRSSADKNNLLYEMGKKK